MSDPRDSEITRLLDRLAEQAPPPPRLASIHRRQKHLRRRQQVLTVVALFVIAPVVGLLLNTNAKPQVTVPLSETDPPSPSQPEAPRSSTAVLAAISEAVGPLHGESLTIIKNHRGLVVIGQLPTGTLERLDALLIHVARIDIHVAPGSPARLRAFLSATA